MNDSFQVVPYQLARCPRCDQRHSFALRLQPAAKAEEKVPIFGGPSRPGASVAFTCPVTAELFVVSIPNPSEGEIIGPYEERREAHPANAKLTSTPVDNMEVEFSDWIKISRLHCTRLLQDHANNHNRSNPGLFRRHEIYGFRGNKRNFVLEADGCSPIAFFTFVPRFCCGTAPYAASFASDRVRSFPREAPFTAPSLHGFWNLSIRVGISIGNHFSCESRAALIYFGPARRSEGQQ